MKNFLFLIGVLLATPGTSQLKNVLFIGDNFTITNDLPDILYQLALSKGDTLEYETSAPQQTTLIQHALNATTIDLLDDGGWDHVVIQEQGQQPIFAIDQVETQVFQPAQDIVDFARLNSECCMPVFFMTWGYENGDDENCADIPAVCDFIGMTTLLSERYLQMAQDNDCWVAPIGEAWRYVRQITGDSIPLYEANGIQPNVAGSYLTACVLYASIWGENPMGSVYYAGLPEDDGYLLQTAANQIVLEQNDDWNFISYLDADLIFSGGNPFTTIDVVTSFYIDSILVTFEGQTFIWVDGSSSSILLEDGTHYFEVEIYSSCVNEVGFFLDSIVIGNDVGLSEREMAYNLYPNPFENELRIEGLASGDIVYMTDQLGRRIQCDIERFSDVVILRTEVLPSGTYFVVIGDALKPKVIKVFRK